MVFRLGMQRNLQIWKPTMDCLGVRKLDKRGYSPFRLPCTEYWDVSNMTILLWFSPQGMCRVVKICGNYWVHGSYSAVRNYDFHPLECAELHRVLSCRLTCMVLHGELRLALFFTIKNALPFPAQLLWFFTTRAFFLSSPDFGRDIRYVIGETFHTCLLYAHAKTWFLNRSLKPLWQGSLAAILSGSHFYKHV